MTDESNPVEPEQQEAGASEPTEDQVTSHPLFQALEVKYTEAESKRKTQDIALGRQSKRLEKLEQAETERLNKKVEGGNPDASKQKIANLEDALVEAKESLESERKSKHELIVKDRTRKAAGGLVKDDAFNDWFSFYGQELEVEESGSITLKTQAGTVEDYIKRSLDERSWLAESQTAGGTGVPTPSNTRVNGTAGLPTNWNAMSDADQQRWMTENPEAAKEVASRAFGTL